MSEHNIPSREGEAGEWDFLGSIETLLPTPRPTPEDSMAPIQQAIEIAATTSKPLSNTGYIYDPGARCPPTPPLPPADLQASPLRYPETLNTLIEIRSSESKGLGVFALTDIPAGTILLSESPLVTLIDTGTRTDPLDIAIAALTPTQRSSFLSLHAYSRNPNESLHRSIVYSNGYSIMKDMATGVFETASRINHSCVPNSRYVWKEAVGRMVFWNRTKLLEGEEVMVDYGHRPNQLLRIYGFECTCGGCTERGSEVLSSENGSSGKAGEKIDGIIAGGLDGERKECGAILATAEEDLSKGKESGV